jgi:hypothetical protein
MNCYQAAPETIKALVAPEVTLIADIHAPDDLYEDVRTHFSEAETVNLTMLIGAINAWNRTAISFRAVHPVKAKAALISANLRCHTRFRPGIQYARLLGPSTAASGIPGRPVEPGDGTSRTGRR